MLVAFERNGKPFGQPEDGCHVGHVADNVNGATGAGVGEGVFLDEGGDVGAEEFSDVFLESFFEEDFVEDLEEEEDKREKNTDDQYEFMLRCKGEVMSYIRSSVVFLLFIPTKHKLVAIGAVRDGSLVHGAEGCSVFKNLLTSFLGVNSDHGLSCRTLEVVLLDHTIAFEDLLHGFGSVEGEQSVCRSTSEAVRKTSEEDLG